MKYYTLGRKDIRYIVNDLRIRDSKTTHAPVKHGSTMMLGYTEHSTGPTPKKNVLSRSNARLNSLYSYSSLTLR